MCDDDPPATYRCPCCGYLTLPERGSYDICPVCFWEDDGSYGTEPEDDILFEGGPNGIALRHAQANFRSFGACDERSLQHVRLPRPEEL